MNKPLDAKNKKRNQRLVTLSAALQKIMQRHPTVNWSEIARQAWMAEIKRLNDNKPTLEERVVILEKFMEEKRAESYFQGGVR